MIKRISTVFFALVVIGLVMNFTFKNEGNKKPVLLPNIVITGDETPVQRNAPVVNADANNFDPILYSDSVLSFTDVRTGPQSIYDLQSNGVCQQIWQDPNTPGNIHAVFTVNLTPGWPAANRRVYYCFSSDFGVTWTDYGANPPTGTNGFGSVTGLSDGSAVIAGHTDFGSAPTRLQIFADVAPGAGTFTQLDPGINPFNSTQNIWGRTIATSNITNTRKVVIIGSMNLAADTMASYNSALSLTTSSFTGWTRYPDADNAETYSFSIGADGRIGLAYVANDNSITTNRGDVKYSFSTNDGLTWAAPITIWDAPPYVDGVFGCLRGVTLTFIGNTPKVAFELMGLTATGYYPGLRAAIGIWAPDINGGVGFITPFDSTWMRNGNGGATDVMTSICRPSIARSNNGQVLMMVFGVSRTDSDAIGSRFYDVYFSTSTNGGANWKFPPTKLTNVSGPLRDHRFANLSPTNDFTGGFYYANLVYQHDSIPGSVTQTPPAAESFAKQRFIRAKLINLGLPGIQPIGNEIPSKFNLEQNYPNPFNPVTKIRFSVPKSANVTLEVYDVTGKLVATLAKNEAVTAGLKEIEFNAVNLPSGIYFYSLKSADFTETKKMVLVK